MDREAKVSTVTPSSDLQIRGQRSKRSKLKTISNYKNISVNVFYIDRNIKKVL